MTVRLGMQPTLEKDPMTGGYLKNAVNRTINTDGPLWCYSGPSHEKILIDRFTVTGAVAKIAAC